MSYRVQHFDDEHPPVVLAEFSGKSDRLIAATCRANGQVLVMATGKHDWNVAGTILQIDAQPLTSTGLFIVSMYPEGVLAEGFNRRRMVRPVPLFWIPIKDGKLDMAAKIELEQEGFSFHCHRHLNEIAWMNAPGRALRQSLVKPAAKLSVFDLTANSVRSVDLPEAEFSEGADLSGFEGSHAFDGVHVIDVATGQLKKIAKIDAIGMQDGVIYGVEKTDDELKLISTPIQNPEARHTIFTMPKSALAHEKWSMPWNTVDVHRLVIVGDKTIHAWNGQTWVKLK